MSRGNGSGHPAHLPAKFREVVSGINRLSKDAGDQDQPNRERGENDDGELGTR